MADALVSAVLEQLTSIIGRQIREEVELVRGVDGEVQRLTRNFRSIKAVIGDAEKKRVTSEAVQNWVDELKDSCYELDDVLDEWNTAILKLRINPPESVPSLKRKVFSRLLSPCFSFSGVVLRRDIALRIKDINRRIDGIASDKDKFSFNVTAGEEECVRPMTTSFVDVSTAHGRDEEMETLLSRLFSERSEGEVHLPIISIVGMGGVGKTTLAQMAYKDESVNAHFQEKMWVCVSDPFDEIRIARAIIEGLGSSAPNIFELQTLLQKISESVKDKKFLLVLDDVWTEDYKKWEPLRNCLGEGCRGSKILMTTRSEKVAKIAGTTQEIPLGGLSRDVCWSIFSQVAFFGRREVERKGLEEIGRKIANRCKGLPLAAKVLGGLMRFKRSEQDWKNVLESDLWKLEEVKRDIISPLWLSYYDLPLVLKRCFSFCAMFPKDCHIKVDRLVKFWMANDFVDSTELGQDYFDNLAMRSFFQEFEKNADGEIRWCKMHDIMHDFAQFLTKDECHAFEVLKGEEVGMYYSHDKLRHSTFNYGGNDSSIFSDFHMQGLHTLVLNVQYQGMCDALPGLLSCLTRLRVLELNYVGLNMFPQEVGKLIHLRYLGIHGESMKELPETLYDLCNLQTLELRRCCKLKRLPHKIRELINLRHLVTSDDVTWMPSGIGALTSLETLTHFITSPKEDEGEGCKIGDLEKLNSLRGQLSISGLSNVDNAKEAKRAALRNKEGLRRLVLDFGGSGDAAVIEALEPPPTLLSLHIQQYYGTQLPSWIVSLSRMRHLWLGDCPNLKSLPHGFENLSLQKLLIGSCPILVRRCQMWAGEDWHLISHIPSVKLL